jgi:hypothetical protein
MTSKENSIKNISKGKLFGLKRGMAGASKIGAQEHSRLLGLYRKDSKRNPHKNQENLFSIFMVRGKRSN